MSSIQIYGIVDAAESGAKSFDHLADGIRLIAEGDIAAIVGDASATPADDSAAREISAQHAQILEIAAAYVTVLPLRPYSVAPDDNAARQILAQGRALLAAHLREFAGLTQMNVTVEWPLTEIFVEIATEPGIAELRAAALSGDDIEAQVQLGSAVKDALQRRRSLLLGDICTALRTVASDIAANPLAGERFVADIALLIGRGRESALEDVLRRLGADNAKLTFHRSGPLPLSAFAALEITFPTRAAVEQAWHTLQLGSRARAGEIKSSYFRIARELQPEHGRIDTQSAGMDELAKAHRLLMACAKTSGEELQLHGPAMMAINVTRSGLAIPPAATPEEAASIEIERKAGVAGPAAMHEEIDAQRTVGAG